MMKFRRWSSFFALGGLVAVTASGCDDMQDDGPAAVAGTALSDQPASEADLVDPATSLSYASRVYGHFQAASNGGIAFTLRTLDSGAASSLVGQTVNSTLGVPGYWINHDAVGTIIERVTVEPRDPASDEWSSDVWLTAFNDLGHPIADASYRKLAIEARVADATMSSYTHAALELCWPTQSYCILMDPVVLQINSFAADRAVLQAAGWKLETVYRDLPDGPTTGGGPVLSSPGTSATGAGAVTAAAAARHCRLASNPAKSARELNVSGYRRTYEGIFGQTLVQATLGAQRAGIRCRASGSTCVADTYGDGLSSSCWTNLGWDCACAATDLRTGKTGASIARVWAETKCTHRYLLSAAASFSVKGTNASFAVNWNTAGSVDSNGGHITDTCGWY